MTDPTELLKARLRAGLKQAMLGKQAADIKAIRGLLAAIDNAQAVEAVERTPQTGQHRFGDGSAEVARRELTEGDLRSLIEQEYEARNRAADDMDRLGRPQDVEDLRDEQAVIARYRLG
jgi:uncharacterized protein YqeY